MTLRSRLAEALCSHRASSPERIDATDGRQVVITRCRDCGRTKVRVRSSLDVKMEQVYRPQFEVALRSDLIYGDRA